MDAAQTLTALSSSPYALNVLYPSVLSADLLGADLSAEDAIDTTVTSIRTQVILSTSATTTSVSDPGVIAYSDVSVPADGQASSTAASLQANVQPGLYYVRAAGAVSGTSASVDVAFTLRALAVPFV